MILFLVNLPWDLWFPALSLYAKYTYESEEFLSWINSTYNVYLGKNKSAV